MLGFDSSKFQLQLRSELLPAGRLIDPLFQSVMAKASFRDTGHDAAAAAF
jgi:hypothetical protein